MGIGIIQLYWVSLRLTYTLKITLRESHLKKSPLEYCVCIVSMSPLILLYTYFSVSLEKPRCPEKHIYKECGPSNPATCSNVAPFQDSECVSGCTCPEGNWPVRIYTIKQMKIKWLKYEFFLTRYLMNSPIQNPSF